MAKQKRNNDLLGLIKRWEDKKNIHQYELDSGLRKFEKLLSAINPDYEDVVAFLVDNPGAIMAMRDWIGEQNLTEWCDSLEEEFDEEQEADDDDTEDEELE